MTPKQVLNTILNGDSVRIAFPDKKASDQFRGMLNTAKRRYQRTYLDMGIQTGLEAYVISADSIISNEGAYITTFSLLGKEEANAKRSKTGAEVIEIIPREGMAVYGDDSTEG